MKIYTLLLMLMGTLVFSQCTHTPLSDTIILKYKIFDSVSGSVTQSPFDGSTSYYREHHPMNKDIVITENLITGIISYNGFHYQGSKKYGYDAAGGGSGIRLQMKFSKDSIFITRTKYIGMLYHSFEILYGVRN